MKNIFKAYTVLKSNLNASMVHLALHYFSVINYIKSMFHKDLLVINKEYQTGAVLLLALYEKGELRSDIKKLLKSAKEKNLYVIAVNTRKLSLDALNETHNLIDVYIQQYNFGRDFGSYKKGFSYIYKSGLSAGAPKVLMLNDSVYYDSTRVDRFIDEMLDSAYEVKGATENQEINYHLGSFAICFDKVIVNNNKFKAYWENYRRSDVRPLVIKEGEMALSKVLKKIVSADSKIGACYNVSRVSCFLAKDTNLDQYVRLLRQSAALPWPVISIKNLVEDFIFKYGINESGLAKRLSKSKNFEDDKLIIQKREIPRFYPVGALNIENLLSLALPKFVGEGLQEEWLKYLKASLVENSRAGSQIHQNGPCYMLLGLAIVKLDGIYRGMFDDYDIQSFKSIMTEENFLELETLLNQKPSGFDNLEGWKLDAFVRGLI